MPPSLSSVRKAIESDVDIIYEIIQPYVLKEILLSRSKKQIYNDLNTTWVFEEDNEIMGSINLTFFNPELCEVRALAIKPEHHRKQIGKRLLQEAIQHIKKVYTHQIRLFALTYIPDFFLKFGFQKTSKENFPEKVYDICEFCHRKEACKEVAVELYLNHE